MKKEVPEKKKKYNKTTYFSTFRNFDLVICDYQVSSVTQSRPTLCNTKDCSTPGFPVHHQLPKLIQTHIH